MEVYIVRHESVELEWKYDSIEGVYDTIEKALRSVYENMDEFIDDINDPDNYEWVGYEENRDEMFIKSFDGQYAEYWSIEIHKVK